MVKYLEMVAAENINSKALFGKKDSGEEREGRMEEQERKGGISYDQVADQKE